MFPNGHLLFFLRAFINELLGRYVSLYQFIDRARREAGGQSTTLLEEYSNKLDEHVVELLTFLNTLYDLPVPDDQVNKDLLVGFFGSLISQSEEFQKIHRTLRWFSEPWPEAEIFQFLSKVFKERGLQNEFQELNPSIVFHDVYNFLTYDIGYMQHSVNRADLDAWALPKAESANPLLWTVLVHEVAHDIYDEGKIYNYLHERLDDFPKYESKEFSLIELLNLWSRELNADLFSFHVLGPAYLYSLIYFSVFFVRNDLRTPIISERVTAQPWGLEKEDILHPAPKDRINLLLHEMSSLNLHKAPEHKQTYEIFDSLFKARCEFDTSDNVFESKESERMELPPEMKNKLWQILGKMQRGVFPQDRMFGVKDLTNATSLFKRLKNQELACSLPAPMRDLDKVTLYIDGDKKVSRKLALEQLNEEPARMIDIINAGWMNKSLDRYLSRPVSSFPGLDKVKSRWPQLLDKLIEPSRQLQKSIQVALIISPILQSTD